ncbi:MAG: excinuclease ABC subunit UvrC [Syntrophales bacterium]
MLTIVDLELKVKNAPRSPGVYLMKDERGGVIYVGKARDLRMRIRAYFLQTDSRAMIPFLVSRIRDIEFILTQTEKEALILENNLIKEHRPRYNVNFRDDKSYYNIRIDPSEEFPRFQLVRRSKKDGARYFGPYPSGGAARETIRFLQSILPLRSCRDRELKMRRRPCLEYEIGRCSAPCLGLIDREEYLCLVKDGIAFLEGRAKSLLGGLRVRMNNLAEGLRFEEAAVLRDRIAALKETLEKQRIVSMAGRNRDVFGLCREDNLTQVVLLFVREGRMTGRKTFPLIRLRAETGEMFSSLLMQYYDGVVDIPDEIVAPVALEDGVLLAEWLSEKKGKAVAVVFPQRGEVLALLRIAQRNAESALKTSRLADDSPEEALRILQEKLSLGSIPRHIECFDISNISGQYAVGSLVAFTEGVPDKGNYRRFRIRTVSGADDFAMMYEVLSRRYQKKERLPDLIVVDGGKGQLGVAVAAMKDLQIEGVELIGLAKERDEAPSGSFRYEKTVAPPAEDLSSESGAAGGKNDQGRGRSFTPAPVKDTPGKSEDRVFLPGRKDPVYLSRWPSAFFLLQRIRDEAHRFAITYHRKIRQKGDLQSLLDQIPGIGPARKKALLVYFGDLGKIRQASMEDLIRVKGIGEDVARKILAALAGTRENVA